MNLSFRISAPRIACNARKANYPLDVPPDRAGRIPEAMVTRLKEIGDLLGEGKRDQ